MQTLVILVFVYSVYGTFDFIYMQLVNANILSDPVLSFLVSSILTLTQ